jgi:hypothetical protein
LTTVADFWRCCRRTTYYVARDLLAVFGNRSVFDFRLECSRCESAVSVHADIYSPSDGDWGNLAVRRPGPVKWTQTWRTVKLGDEVAK